MPDRVAVARSMARLRHRPLSRRDIVECMELLPPWLDLDAARRAELPGLWTRLLDAPAVITGVIEDLSCPPGKRLQGWGVTIAVPPDWPALALHDGRLDAEAGSTFTRDVYIALLDGRFALMSERQIGQANAAGSLVLVALHYRQRVHDITDPYGVRVLTIANETFRIHHAGYQLAALYQQAQVEDESYLTGAGFQRCTEPRPGRSTVMYGLTRAEAGRVLPGNSLHEMFVHQPPVFRFSASQRRLLWLALYDDNDEALMSELGVSVHGLKKLWRGIYERIEDVVPEFFGDGGSDDDGRRGPEKRRQVLAHVRQRPEELRPWVNS